MIEGKEGEGPSRLLGLKGTQASGQACPSGPNTSSDRHFSGQITLGAMGDWVLGGVRCVRELQLRARNPGVRSPLPWGSYRRVTCLVLPPEQGLDFVSGDRTFVRNWGVSVTFANHL